MSAYDVLAVDPKTANDLVIRQAYLTLIREHSPDSDPDRFQQIRSSYHQIETEEKRLSYELFAAPATGLSSCIDAMTQADKTFDPPTTDLIREVLLEAMDREK